MPLLLDLSNELLYQIIDQIHPDDIPNFSLTCKDVHTVAGDAVHLHMDREKISEGVVLHGCHRHEDNAHPLQLMKEICMDWRVGEYVKFLKIQCCGPHADPDLYPDEADEKDTRRYEVEKREDRIKSESLMRVIRGCVKEKAAEWDFPPQTPVDVESLCNRAARGERTAMFALLLLFTPRLKGIQNNEFSWDDDCLQDVTFPMREQSVQRGPSARKLVLDTVKLKGNFDGRGPEIALALLYFAALPSVQTLLGFHVWAPRGQLREQFKLPPNVSNVKRLSQMDSAVHDDRIESFLLGIKSLENFSYSHNYDLANGHGMRAVKIFTSLHRHARHSLKFLGIWGGVRPLLKPNDTISRCLHGFEVLKELHLSYWVYIEMLPWRGPPEARLTRDDVQPLVYALPPSIEKVGLLGFRKFDCVSALLVDFVEQKDLRLPRLTDICVDGEEGTGGDERWVTLVETCAKVGVTMKIDFE